MYIHIYIISLSTILFVFMIRIRRKSNFIKHPLNLTFKKKEFKCYLVMWNPLELLDLPVFKNESCDFNFPEEILSNIWKRRGLSGSIQGYTQNSVSIAIYTAQRSSLSSVFSTHFFPSKHLYFHYLNQVLIHIIFLGIFLLYKIKKQEKNILSK